MSTVWVLLDGMAYEGEDIEGVFASREAAIRALQEVMARTDGKLWKQDPTDANTWNRNSRWLTVKEFEVKE